MEKIAIYEGNIVMAQLSAQMIRAGLQTQFIGQTVYHWPAVGSTNVELKGLAEAGAPEGTLAISEEQLSGRGRLGRTWTAPAGSSLLMSLLFRPNFLAPARVQQLTMLCSLAGADAVAKVTGLRPALKWPNDLLLGGKKLAGILTEVGCEGEVLSWVVVGLGLNVNLDFAAQAPELADTAISLATALGQSVSRLPLLQSYLTGVEQRYTALQAGHSPHQEWAARLATLGQQVIIHAPNGIYQGLAEGVDELGALLLRRPDGQVMRVLSGDVTLRD